MTTIKFMALRRADACACGQPLAVGERAAWDKSKRVALCLPCATAVPPTDDVTELEPIDVGIAGGSAHAEFERRHHKREQRVRDGHLKIGGLLLAISDDPQSTRAWATGGVGEQRVGEELAKLGDTVTALHDRCVPRGRANIDHVVVGPSGVFVIDTKRYNNARVELRRSGGFLSPVREQLVVRGRDQTKMIDAMEWQIEATRTAVAGSSFAEVPLIPVLCFVDAQLPWSGKIDIGCVRVRGPKGTGRLVSGDGPLDGAMREELARVLAVRLPAKRSVGATAKPSR